MPILKQGWRTPRRRRPAGVESGCPGAPAPSIWQVAGTGVLLCFLWLTLAGCTGDGEAEASVASDDQAAAQSAAQTGAQTPAGPPAAAPPASDARDVDTHTHHPESEEDWAVAAQRVGWGVEEGLHELAMGEAVVRMAASFVGTPYEPGTLELPGQERLVVHLQAFDCVTLIEHVLVLTRLVREAQGQDPSAQPDFRDRYREELIRIRYRDGRLDGYLSRLHYFTEWLDQGLATGALTDVTQELGGVVDDRPIHFMSSNPDAYRQLAEDPTLVEAIQAHEVRLSQGTRHFIPQDRIREVEEGIQDGDIIAAVSRLEGLDIAHTGFAIHQDGRLHLLHAPLVGDSVEITERPLAERLQGISAQVGIRVVRPNH